MKQVKQVDINSPPSFDFQARPAPDMPDVLYLEVRGTVTYRDAPELRAAILREMRACESSKIVVELSQVEKIDTAGVAVLVECLQLAQARGCRLVLCQPNQLVLQVFRLSGLQEALNWSCMSPEMVGPKLME